jgi:hypothetical protein
MENEKITSVKDLIPGQEYFIFWGGRLIRKCVFLAIVQEYELQQILIADLQRGKWTSTNLPYVFEIGIGKSKAEAVANYGALKSEKIETAYKTSQEAREKTFHFLKNY